VQSEHIGQTHVEGLILLDILRREGRQLGPIVEQKLVQARVELRPYSTLLLFAEI
jgi:hypothetical protein